MPSTGEGVGTRQQARPDHNGLERKQVSDIQRARMLAAMAEAAHERGAGNVTVADVVARSGVSRRTFYEQFANREECFLAAFDEALRRVRARVVPAYESQARWRDRIRASLAELLCFLDEQPAMSGMLIVQALGAGPQALARRQDILNQVVGVVDGGRAEAVRGSEPAPMITEGVVGAVFSIVHSRFMQAKRQPLVELVPQLMSMIVLPYLGPAAARRELARPAASLSGSPIAADNGLNPLRDLEMRLTYRTMRVLLSIGQQPGASNRQIATAAGIADQGQVSKLLTRLEHRGLIQNRSDARVKGEPNAWSLTERGAAVREAISTQTSQP